MNSLSQRIHAALPQTQCTRCGYPDCAAYAEAIATGQALINQCPPGGAEGVQQLAAITGQATQALNPVHGEEGPRKTVFIDESWCIGCTLCIKACPTDAIVGSNKKMHTVQEAYCTGCELCLPVCPVDCIETEPVDEKRSGWDAWSADLATQSLRRYTLRNARLNPQASAQHAEQNISTQGPVPVSDAEGGEDGSIEAAQRERRQRLIKAALAKARGKSSG